MTQISALLAAVGLLGWAAGSARADSFAPVGLWRGETSGDFLFVWGDGFCSFGGSVTVAGRCTWEAGDQSGTLSLMAEATPGSERLDLGVLWLNGDTILVDGLTAGSEERFRRSG